MAYMGFILAAATLLVTFAYPSANGDVSRDPLCPYPSEITTYYPNPSNCTEFFECYEGIKYVMKCNQQLYWNQDELRCDYKENVNCNGADALCVNEIDGTYIANPTDCGKFYECVDHKALGGKCAPGTLWNQEIRNCDYPQNVKCSQE